MKKILIPTDFSENSYKAIDYITELFKNEACSFYFLNVYIYETGSLNAIEMLQADDDWFEKPKEDSLQQLGDLLDEYAVNRYNTKHEYYVISEGLSLVKAIKKHIETVNADLIVLKGNAKPNKNIQSIIGEIRTCPVLIVPPCASINKTLNLTIASTFKEAVRTLEIDIFLETFKNTNFEINILALGKKDVITVKTSRNIKLLRNHLKNYSNKSVGLEFTEKPSNLKEYAISHLSSIMCVVDKKPDLLRKVGLCKSKIISTIEKLHSNPVLTIHQ
ncbi:universal stress protein [Algibacter sp. L4_22]|uniref:universal stress protein n=1 Tax=Algibacter sp. L4_22 TaxID=2942477 RepID=UPI00201B48E4|nr:universal stress protein [Algibacter sp. L4_22]MCL5128418.1 universal stress protein [Algibacter sp. L4_22]